MDLKIKKVCKFLRDNDNFCFLCHKNLDGDTLGAAYSLYYSVLQLNKKAVVKTFEDETLKKFSFLYPEEEVEKFEIENYVCVDVADLKLLEKKFENERISLCIDHHKTNKIIADYKYVDEKSAATCEIVYLILKELKINITKKIAECLYFGIATDTGCFKYDNVTAKTHIIASDLILKGANFSYINFVVFDSKTKERLNLEKEVIENLKYYYNDRCVIVFLTDDMVKKIGATKEDCGSVSYIASSVESAFFAITARQQESGFKISVRTKEKYDASLFCEKFGGGGHKKAAGCFIEGAKEIVLKKLLLALKEEFKF